MFKNRIYCPSRYFSIGLTVISLLSFSNILNANTINIPNDYTTIQAGINSASNGDTIIVQPGTYVENMNFNGKNIVVGSLYLTTQDTSYISQTIIDGNQNGSVVWIHTDSFTNLTGLTIQNGFANTGAGINTHSDLTIYRCIIKNNNATETGSNPTGGGVLIQGGQNNIIDCKIYNNSSTDWGGGISAYSFDPDCKVFITNCEIYNNSSERGAGIYARHMTDMLIDRCNIHHNTAKDGGGVSSETPIGLGRLTIQNSIVHTNNIDNSSAWRGGGISVVGNCDLVILNSTITNNYSQYGSGVDSWDGSRTLIMNSIIYNNDANTINLYNNSDGGLYFAALNSLIEGGYNSVTGIEVGDTIIWSNSNISSNPQFNDPSNYDYFILDESPCISKGRTSYQYFDDNIESPAYDYLNKTRPMPINTKPDMGAYENQTAYPDTTYITGGTITQDSTWTKAQSPYVISGDVVVDNGATLTIEPGVEVLFQAVDRTTDEYSEPQGCAYLRFNNGNLFAQGSENDTIYFLPYTSDGEDKNWGSLKRGKKLDLKYCKIVRPWNIEPADSTYIDHCTISGASGHTISHVSGYLEFTNSQINDSYSFGITMAGGNYCLIQNNIFSNLGGAAFNNSGGGSGTFSFIGNDFSENIDANPTYIHFDYLESGMNINCYHNNFSGPNEAFSIGNGPNLTVNVQNNYWGSIATAEMNSGDNPKNISTIGDIFDYDNAPFIDYSHWLDAPWPDGQAVGDSYDAEMLITDNQYTDEMLTYHSGDSIFIQITDLDRNSDDIIPDQLTLDIWSETETTHETLTLNETDLATGIFRGWIKLDDATGVPFPDGQLQVSHGDWMYFQYIDPADDWGNVDTNSLIVVYDAKILHGGNIDSDSTLCVVNSPYIVAGDINVNGQLSIEPGCYIYFIPNYNDGMGGTFYESSLADFGFYGNSVFHAEGTEQDSIYFMSVNDIPENTDWGGFHFDHNSDGYFKYCVLKDFKGLVHYGDTLKVTHSNLKNLNYGILTYGSSKYAEISNNTFRDIGPTGWAQPASIALNPERLILESNSFIDCYRGIQLPGLPEKLKITGNYFENISEYCFSFQNYDYSGAIIKYNSIIDNSLAIGHDGSVGSPYEVPMKFNYWGPIATAEMNSGNNPKNITTIQDYFDNTNWGIINYSRWLDAPRPDGSPAPGGYTGEMNFIYSDCSDAWSYNEGDTLYVRLYDPDLNTDINTPEYATVEVWSQLETVPEMLNLNEVDADTGLFTGWMLLDSQTGFAITDGMLQVDANNKIWVKYIDVWDDWDRINVSTIDSVSYYLGNSPLTQIDNATILYAAFDETDGQTLIDSSKYGNYGFLGNENASDSREPQRSDFAYKGRSLYFKTSDDLARFPFGEFDYTQGTVSLWVNLESEGGDMPLISITNTEEWSVECYHFMFRTNTLHHHTRHNNNWTGEWNVPIDLTTNFWHEVVFTWSGVNRKFFFDGELVREDNNLINGILDSSYWIRIGDNPDGSTFHGYIDEVKISNIDRSIASPIPERPGKINDLAVTDSTSQSIILQWHAPGADNYTGTCEIYDLRISTSPIDSANFISATPVSGLPAPLSAGTLQSFQVENLNYGTTYYFAIKAVDDEGLWSPISNIAVGHTTPSSPKNLVVVDSLQAITIRWSSNSEAGLSHYNIYRSDSSNFTSDSIYFKEKVFAPDTTYIDSLIQNNNTYYYQVTAVDTSGNESDPSDELVITAIVVDIRDIAFKQRVDGSGLVNIYYSFSGHDTTHYEVIPYLSNFNDAAWGKLIQVSGDAGAVLPGDSRQITWNLKSEAPEIYSNNSTIKITIGLPSKGNQYNPLNEAKIQIEGRIER